MERLLRGLSKFQNEVFPLQKHLFQQLADRQNPDALFITCADSRVVPQLITQTDPGDLFICRNAGNIVPPYGEINGGVSATIEYAVMALEVRHVIVCGHSDCGAMRAVMNPEKVERLPTVASWLRHGDLARHVVEEKYPDLDPARRLDVLIKENVIAQLHHLRTHPSVAARLATGRLAIHGWHYYIESARVEAYDAEQGRFIELQGIAPPGHSCPRAAEEILA
jgi:carbonic anhydrase